MSSSQMFLQGLNASFPIVAGYLPIGFAFGVAAEGAQFGTFSAVFVSLLIYAGASQFALVGLLKDGVPLLSVALITISLNIRHFLYGPGLSRETGGFSLSERLVAAFGLTDEVFAIAFSQIKDLPSESRFLWLMGLELVAYACWAVSTLAGSIGGNVLFNYYSFLRPALFLPYQHFF